MKLKDFSRVGMLTVGLYALEAILNPGGVPAYAQEADLRPELLDVERCMAWERLDDNRCVRNVNNFITAYGGEDKRVSKDEYVGEVIESSLLQEYSPSVYIENSPDISAKKEEVLRDIARFSKSIANLAREFIGDVAKGNFNAYDVNGDGFVDTTDDIHRDNMITREDEKAYKKTPKTRLKRIPVVPRQ